MNRVLACALVTIALSPAAFAGEREAKRFYDKANDRWEEKNPEIPIKYALKALEHVPEKGTVLRSNILYLLGRLHHSRTGDFKQAEDYYTKVVRESVGTKDFTLKRIRSDAFRNLGNLIYAESGDVKKALTKYNASHANYPTAETADVLSQFLYRIGRDKNKTKSARTKQLGHSVKLAKEAVERYGKQKGQRNVAEGARFQLQLAMTLKASGKKAEAEKAEKAIRWDKLEEQSAYQQAQFAALKGEDPAKIRELLMQSIAPRPTAKTRDDLRRFIVTEPDFQPFLKREDWKYLVTKETGEGEAPASRPTK